MGCKAKAIVKYLVISVRFKKITFKGILNDKAVFILPSKRQRNPGRRCNIQKGFDEKCPGFRERE